jgi:hypothetical protein
VIVSELPKPRRKLQRIGLAEKLGLAGGQGQQGTKSAG